MGKTIILIHGRDYKPSREPLKELWNEAFRFGLRRDFPQKKTDDVLSGVTIAFVYFGDISNKFLNEHYKAQGDTSHRYDEALDLKDRKKSLKRLMQYSKRDFTKATYESLPGQSSVMESLADVFSGPLAMLRISNPVINYVAPDMREYWNDESEFSSEVRFRLIGPLREAMDRDDEILVVSHSLGSLIAYDTFWKFCRTSDYRYEDRAREIFAYNRKQISLWITMGSPLGDATVQKYLKGASISGQRRYPNNVKRWVNIAAEDDYICHDEIIADDYADMQTDSITDERVYNLAVREGASNPHNELGYLLHPAVTKHVGKWLLE